MKRTLAIFALCVSILFLLTACGEDTMQNDVGDMLDEAGDMMEDAMEGTDGMMRSGRDSSGNTGAIMDDGTGFGDMARNRNATANSQLHGSYNNPTGTPGGRRSTAPKQDEQEDPASAKTRWQLMLDNAHVHDTDGILTDGENPKNDTF